MISRDVCETLFCAAWCSIKREQRILSSVVQNSSLALFVKELYRRRRKNRSLLFVHYLVLASRRLLNKKNLIEGKSYRVYLIC